MADGLLRVDRGGLSGRPARGPNQPPAPAEVYASERGGDPRRWLAEFCRDRKIEKTDRVFHELVVLTDVLFLGGTFDQVNMPALQSFERVGRRLSTIIDAYSSSGTPNWQMSRHYEGTLTSFDAVSPSLRQWGLRRAKEENELRMKRATRGNPGDDAAEDDDVAAGTEEAGRDRARGRGGRTSRVPAAKS